MVCYLYAKVEIPQQSYSMKTSKNQIEIRNKLNKAPKTMLTFVQTYNTNKIKRKLRHLKNASITHCDEK